MNYRKKTMQPMEMFVLNNGSIPRFTVQVRDISSKHFHTTHSPRSKSIIANKHASFSAQNIWIFLYNYEIIQPYPPTNTFRTPKPHDMLHEQISCCLWLLATTDLKNATTEQVSHSGTSKWQPAKHTESKQKQSCTHVKACKDTPVAKRAPNWEKAWWWVRRVAQ